MWSQPLGQYWRYKDILLVVFLQGSRLYHRHCFFHSVFVRLDRGDSVNNQLIDRDCVRFLSIVFHVAKQAKQAKQATNVTEIHLRLTIATAIPAACHPDVDSARHAAARMAFHLLGLPLRHPNWNNYPYRLPSVALVLTESSNPCLLVKRFSPCHPSGAWRRAKTA